MSADNLDFIVIDDSKLDCFIAEKIIRKTGRSHSIVTFSQASEALEYIKNNPGKAGEFKTVILVDIQMPVMTGFEFVEAFEQLPEMIVENYIIYVLSSSINENDLNRARYHHSVKQFLSKPLTTDSVAAVLEQLD